MGQERKRKVTSRRALYTNCGRFVELRRSSGGKAMKRVMKYAGLALVSLFFLVGGQAHFTSTPFFVSIVPPYVPAGLAPGSPSVLVGGQAHFPPPPFCVSIVPPYVPLPLATVYFTGVLELIGAV